MNEVSSFLCSYLPGASELHIHYVVPGEIEDNRTQRKEYFEYDVEICLELCHHGIRGFLVEYYKLRSDCSYLS